MLCLLTKTNSGLNVAGTGETAFSSSCSLFLLSLGEDSSIIGEGIDL